MGAWDTPNKKNSKWRQPDKKDEQKPAELRKATYTKSNLFGKEERFEGRAAGKASRDDERRKR
jgi:hypothetical protein